MNREQLPPNVAPLDRNQLRQVRDNYLALNKNRLLFAQKVFPHNQRHYLELLPALIHFNHPMLPGYCDRKTPAGIYQYQLDEQTQKSLKRLAKSFHPNRSKNQRHDILSLFTMGSLGSLAQSTKSDIDVWLCYRSDLPEKSVLLLHEKVAKITEWAASFGIDTTIFLMNHKDFSRGVTQALDKESSGSTQHCLLLDEFYRTAIYLAGQLPVWIFTTQYSYRNYTDEVTTLLEEKRIPDRQLVNFGSLDQIPNGEFIGAAIWQLYKAINSPYKAIIKLLLIEIYAKNNHAKQFLSNQFKSWLQCADLKKFISIEDYDPFLNTYQLIESYLLEKNQPHRLELVRRCFYFKLASHLNAKKEPITAERQALAKRIIQKWEWTQETIDELNQHQHWKTPIVNRERNLIIKALNESYYFIIDYSKIEKSSINASNKELNILGRKLNAAFSKKAGKVDWINPGISSNIAEPNITIIKKKSHLWLAINTKQEKLLSNSSLIELLVNCHCNQIIDNKTTISFNNHNYSIPIEKAREKIQEKIPSPISPAEHQAFEKTTSITKIVLFIHSFDKPDFFLIPDQPDQQQYYLTQECIIDAITINSWNEIKCHQLKGQANRIIPEVLSQYLHEKSVFDHCEYYFFDENIGQALNTYIDSLKLALNNFLNEHQYGQFLTGHSNQYIALSNASTKTPYTEIRSNSELQQFLNQDHDHFLALAIDPVTLSNSQLAVFAKHNRPDCIQIFFEEKKPFAEITIIDEQGTFYFLTIHYQDPQQSLLPIYTYCRSVNERRLSHNAIDLSPLDILPISIYQLRKTHSRWKAEQIYLNNQATVDRSFAVNGFAEFKNNDFVFTLYCDEQCFSEEDEQAAAFTKMLRWMRSQSKGNTNPRYTITDLDISHCKQAFSSSKNLHTAHYFHVKSILENKLKQALQ